MRVASVCVRDRVSGREALKDFVQDFARRFSLFNGFCYETGTHSSVINLDEMGDNETDTSDAGTNSYHYIHKYHTLSYALNKM